MNQTCLMAVSTVSSHLLQPAPQLVVGLLPQRVGRTWESSARPTHPCKHSFSCKCEIISPCNFYIVNTKYICVSNVVFMLKLKGKDQSKKTFSCKFIFTHTVADIFSNSVLSVCACLQIDLSSSRAQAVGTSVPSDSRLQKPSEGSRSQRGHQAGLHGGESQFIGSGEDPSRKKYGNLCCFLPFLVTFPSFLLLSCLILHFFLFIESKNSSMADSPPLRSEESSLDAETAKSYPPFSSLMLIHIKGQERFGSSV